MVLALGGIVFLFWRKESVVSQKNPAQSANAKQDVVLIEAPSTDLNTKSKVVHPSVPAVQSPVLEESEKSRAEKLSFDEFASQVDLIAQTDPFRALGWVETRIAAKVDRDVAHFNLLIGLPNRFLNKVIFQSYLQRVLKNEVVAANPSSLYQLVQMHLSKVTNPKEEWPFYYQLTQERQSPADRLLFVKEWVRTFSQSAPDVRDDIVKLGMNFDVILAETKSHPVDRF